MIPTILAISGLAILYLYHVNRGMSEVPEEARRLSPRRWTVDEIKAAFEDSIQNPVDVQKSLPPRQNRRYIVVGGSGLVGNWVVTHLLLRGETPSAVRILDLQPPRRELLDQGVTFVQTNITDEDAVLNAFSQPWAQETASLPLTVIHNAAVIRPSERHPAFLSLCRNVNVTGTVHVLNAAKQSGASCFISTSSGSVCLRSPSFWLFPWTRTPKHMVQVINDSTSLPTKHEDFFGNYPVTKAEAERIVRAADDPSSNFRTGCIRPANGIYGIGDDASATITGTYLRAGGNPSWLYPIIQNFVNAENVSLAHLLYEQRLLEHAANPTSRPNCGGQAFVVTDPNPAISFADFYLLLCTLSKTPVAFPPVPAIPFLLLSYLVEWYALLQRIYLPWLLPPVSGDLAQMQPALFAISTVHVVVDDGRARRAPEEGGLGYNPPISTLYGLCKELGDWNRRHADRKSAAAVIAEKKLVGLSVETKCGVDVDVDVVVPPRKV
ncbi:NAD(P)-binding protein [Aspergillus heteromorphus CBS 117.55]|uniref:NAD(P)-binding protein n=1 Tax=Aspergillus heteromorphus CBS 117.55 TaxID=1448321 RepID=A0A317VWH6_9EURO|nr:NAD(P)-binding protein [Aspergillus heteromorphus CBS 117.55]PWY76280.1 NAD(P)-binding protein [Aspergillus heteromorphus CBS 117.55]